MSRQLKKELTLFEIFSIAAGAMVSSGLFVLPGLAYAKTGPSVFVSYLIAGLMAVAGMVSQAELVSAMPKAGGTYFYVTRSLGPAVGAIDGLLTWFSLALKSAFALLGMAAFARLIVDVNIHVISITLTVIFLILNLLGAKEASKVQVALVIGLIALLGFYIVDGLPKVKLANYEPFAPHGAAAIVSAAGFVFISYGGLLKVASVAEEARDPGRTIPLGMFLAFLVISSFYFMVVFVTVGVLGPAMRGSLTPISDGARAIMGKPGQIVLSIAAILAFVSTANAGIMAASRYPLALSRDGLLPEFIGRINKRFGTPHISILITGFFMITSLFLNLEAFVKAASSVLVLSYAFACISLIIMRISGLQNYQPVFRAPLFPWLQIIGLVGYTAMLIEMGSEAILITAILGVIGLLLYKIYGHSAVAREFALLHLVSRITDRKLATRSLESELRQIIRERDQIVEDRFDRLVKSGVVLDFEGKMDTDELFHKVAEHMAPRVGLRPSELYQMLVERESQSSTAITKFIAIPHIVIPGEHKFDIAIIRVREGVFFTKKAPDVKAIFVLLGTKDERLFHLQALAAIAQIVDDPEFESKWMRAKDAEGLRDILLLGKRRRIV